MKTMITMFKNMTDDELLKVAERIDSLPVEALQDLTECMADRLRHYRHNIDVAIGMTGAIINER